MHAASACALHPKSYLVVMIIQGTQLAYSNFVNCQESSAAVPSLQRLQDKTLLEYKPGQSSTPDLIEPWLTGVRSLQLSSRRSVSDKLMPVA
jgi:hypothetical protein